MTTTTTWCETCGNPVTAGDDARCNCWCMVADALQRYLGMDFDSAAQMASDLWTQEADKERVWSADYANDHNVERYPMKKTASQYADEIMTRIHADMSQPSARIPRDVGSFSKLHDFCDANMYVLNAMGEADTYTAETETDEHNALVNAIMDDVDGRLAAEARAINGEPLEWREAENWPYIGSHRLRSLTASSATAEDGTRFVRTDTERGWRAM